MADFDLSKLTWTCHFCKDERPDDKISVAHRPVMGMEDYFPRAQWNLRYCNDRPECIEKAHGMEPWPQKE
jgi:hypothetical protein